jgi:hypothetical protein
MANGNISPELLALLQSGNYTAAPGQRSNLSTAHDGMTSFLNPAYLDQASQQYYMPMYSDSGLDNAGELIRTQTGYYGFDATSPDAIGRMNNTYDTQGNFTGQYETADPKEGEWFDQLVLGTIAAMAGGAALGGLGGGAGASTGGANGAFLGEGAASGIGAWDGAMAGAGGAGAGGGIGTMGTLDLLPTTMGQYELPGLMSTVGGAGAGGATSGLLGKALGVGSTLLGGLAGSQGQESSQTTQRDIPEWLKPYITGANGILPAAQSLLQQQQGYVPQNSETLRNTGLGLLGRGIAPNPYAR